MDIPGVSYGRKSVLRRAVRCKSHRCTITLQISSCACPVYITRLSLEHVGGWLKAVTAGLVLGNRLLAAEGSSLGSRLFFSNENKRMKMTFNQRSRIQKYENRFITFTLHIAH